MPSAIARHPDGLVGKCSLVTHGEHAFIVANAPAPGGDIHVQAIGCLTEMDRLLNLAGSGRDRLLQVTVYLADIAEKADFDSHWMPWIGGAQHWPQCACVGVTLDPGYSVEIVATAAIGEVG